MPLGKILFKTLPRPTHYIQRLRIAFKRRYSKWKIKINKSESVQVKFALSYYLTIYRSQHKTQPNT